ncbi:hypothetical protein FC093_09570 [Ilyomonas limi]|uniref:Beta-carotene 15,15'-monooxygenase n=1 Tax=Ilyomonas limi TaxID=2575867 RepID=A0A4V5UUG3_9BACT|nr:DUF6427 family protein [Ilyomonas limi]TKK68933.1 hypothetical protein FC093_09570 [Ilyomonas limi]
MVSIFREKSTASVFWLILLSIVAHGHFLVHPPAVIVAGGSAAFFRFMTPLAALPDFALIMLYHAIIIVQALRFNTVLNNLRMFPKQYFITALCYILLSALYPAWGNITPALLVNFLIIWVFSLLSRLYVTNSAKPIIYNIGFITSVISILYFPAAFLVIVAFIAVGSLRAFRTNEWIVLLLGILTPPYFIVVISFLTNHLHAIHTYLPPVQLHGFSIKQNIPMIVTAVTGLYVVADGFLMWSANSGKAVMQVRRSWGILLMLFLLSIPLLFLLQEGNFGYLVLGLLPAAAIASNTFIYSKSNLYQTILFWILITVIIYNNWFWLKT